MSARFFSMHGTMSDFRFFSRFFPHGVRSERCVRRFFLHGFASDFRIYLHDGRSDFRAVRLT